MMPIEDDPPNPSVLAVLVLALVSLVGCGGQADEGSVHVHGSNAALIADLTVVEALTRTAPVLDAKFVIVAEPEVDPRRLSLEADLASERLDEPHAAIALTRARLAGLDYGPEYNELQQLQRANGTPGGPSIS